MKKIIAAAVLIVALGTGVVACTDGKGPSNATQNDKNVSNKGLQDLQQAIPTPKFDYSQIRKNLVEIETAEANTTQTTSFFFNQGVADPMLDCPSIGFPIASTTELTNPEQIVNGDNGRVSTIPLPDPIGTFPGNSTGTFVICIDAQGNPYAHYWEGFVSTVTGPATWDTTQHQVVLTGPPSFQFSKGK